MRLSSRSEVQTRSQTKPVPLASVFSPSSECRSFFAFLDPKKPRTANAGTTTPIAHQGCILLSCVGVKRQASPRKLRISCCLELETQVEVASEFTWRQQVSGAAAYMDVRGV